MIDFIFKFKELYLSWQSKKSQCYSLTQIAGYTQTSLPYVIKYISDSLKIELEYTKNINFTEAKTILEILTQKYKHDIEERLKLTEEKTKSTIASYQIVISKANKLQISNQWDIAFKTLSYFAGEYANDLPRDLFVNLCSNIVRSGIKAKNINLQEISRWLRKGVERNLSEHSKESLKDALDLVEAYSSYFQNESSGKGQAVLVEILALVESPACELQLWNTYKSCIDNLFFKQTHAN